MALPPAEVHAISFDTMYLWLFVFPRQDDLFPAETFFVYVIQTLQKGWSNQMPSAKILNAKAEQTAVLAEKIKAAKAGVIVNYAGITVDQDTKLRADLRKAGVEYKVYKNTMTERACADAGYPDMKQYLTGMTAVATSANDEVAAAKILKEYADKVETFELVAGFIDGGVIDKAGVEKLAAIPNKETLVCKIMLGMQSPLYGLAYALQAIIDKSGEAVQAEAPAETPAE